MRFEDLESRCLLSSAPSLAALVSGVHQIATYDGLPGPIEVTSAWTPIVFGDSDAYTDYQGQHTQPCLLAAAREYGSGRVLAAGHEGFFSSSDIGDYDNELFGRNILRWLDKQSSKVICVRRTMWSGAEEYLVDRLIAENPQYTKRIVARSDELTASDVQGCGVLIYATQWDSLASRPNEIDAIVDFAAGGGGVWLVGLGWSYASYIDPNLDHFPMNQVGSHFGVRFENGFLNDPTDYVNNGSCHPLFHTFYPSPLPSHCSISGTVFADTNGNGTQDSGESGLAAWTVFIDKNGNGELDSGEYSATSDGDGAYQFPFLAPGTYTIAEVVPSPWTRTSPGGSGTYTFTLSQGHFKTGVNFGNKAAAPAIAVSTNILDFGENKTSLTFKVWNSGGGTLNYNIGVTETSVLDAVSISPSVGTSSDSNGVPHTVTLDRSKVDPGKYSAHLVITSGSLTKTIQLQFDHGTTIRTAFQPLDDSGVNYKNAFPFADTDPEGLCYGFVYASLYYYCLNFSTKDTPAQHQYIEQLQHKHDLDMRAAKADMLLNWSSEFIRNQYTLVKSVLADDKRPCPIGLTNDDWLTLSPHPGHALLVWRITETPTTKVLYVYDSTRVSNTRKLTLHVENGIWTMDPYTVGTTVLTKFCRLTPFYTADCNLAYTLHSPAHLRIIDPNGNVFETGGIAQEGVAAWRGDMDDDGEEEEIVAFVEPVPGNYTVEVIPFTDADPDATLTLDTVTWGQTQTVLDGVRVADLLLEVMTFNVPSAEEVPPTIACLLPDSTTIDEGSQVTLMGGFTDPSPSDTHTVVIDWGDTTSDTLTLEAGTFDFTIAHCYFDESPSEDGYPIYVKVSDARGDDTANTAVVVRNVAPSSVGLAFSAYTIDENGSTALTGTFVDPGTLDTHTVLIDWGDGTDITTLNLAAGVTDIPETVHQYVNNLPGNAPYTISVTVADEEEASAASTAQVTVDNVAPSCSISGSAGGVPGQPLTFTLAAMDLSPVDQAAGFAYRIDWGDGSAPQTIPQAPGNGDGLQTTHAYTRLGRFTARVTATDNDGGVSQICATMTTITSTVIGPAFGDPATLLIGGTAGNDVIFVVGLGLSGDVGVLINGRVQGIVAGRKFGTIGIYGGTGNDFLYVASNVRRNAFLFGEDGNDRLCGGGGNNVLVGGQGNDFLLGGTRRNLLIGGAGRDILNAAAGDSVLIGGTTDYDSSDAALAALLAEWSRTNATYQQRVAHLTGAVAGGLNGSFSLNAATVANDVTVDFLLGGPGSDLFFASRGDLLPAGRRGERILWY